MRDSGDIKKVPSLNGYYRRVNFGLASARLGLTGNLLQECADRKSFQAAELPYEYFQSLPERNCRQLRERFGMLCCGNLLPPELTTLILSAGRNIQQEFVRTVGEFFRDLVKQEIRCGALDFSLTQLLLQEDPGPRETLSRLLRELHPALQETGLKLLLPVRLPLPEPTAKEKITGFLRGQLIPNLKLRLEIHPHELKPDFDPEKLAGTFRLETGAVLFCCNADTGNRLLRQHLTPWMRYFALTGFPGPFFFCPFSRENRLAAVESESCSRLAEELITLR